MMNNDQFSPLEQALIERLKNAPETKLGPEKVTAIRGQLLAAVDVRPSPSITFANSKHLFLVALIIIGTLLGLVLIGLPLSDEPNENANPPTVAPTSTIQIATLTPTSVILTPPPTEVVYPMVVIEGPVTEIRANSVTVFGTVIQVNDSTVLSDLQLGDTVRVDGQTIIMEGTVTINATTIVIVKTEDTSGGGSTGGNDGGLPQNCKRTKRGKITCK
jgi:hypothetical protein